MYDDRVKISLLSIFLTDFGLFSACFFHHQFHVVFTQSLQPITSLFPKRTSSHFLCYDDFRIQHNHPHIRSSLSWAIICISRDSRVCIKPRIISERFWVRVGSTLQGVFSLISACIANLVHCFLPDLSR